MDPRKAVPVAILIVAAIAAMAAIVPRDGTTGGSVSVSTSSGSTIPFDPGNIIINPPGGGGGDITKPECYPGDPCDDGNICTIDFCSNDGTCKHEKAGPITCESDGNDCTKDICDEMVCSHRDMPDGTVCEGDGVCEQGVCEHNEPPGCKSNSECNDGDVCTTDICGNDGRCSNVPIPNCCEGDTECDDGLECTLDSCVSTSGSTLVGAGTCVHTTRDGQPCSSDGNDCTQDICSGNDCKHAPITLGPGSCDDNNDCTSGDYCSNGNCVGGTNICRCDDSHPCDEKECKTVKCDGGVCDYDPMPNGIACGEFEQCRRATCQNGDCDYYVIDGPCDDGNPCTIGDECDSSGNCRPGATNPDCYCDETNPCPSAPKCQVVFCNRNTCDYKPAPSSTICDDGDPCTGGDHCADGSCVSGEFICECQGNADCTAGECRYGLCKDGNCEYSDLPDGTTCDDSNDCTEGDVCSAGACDGQNACECERDKDCDDDDESTEDKCVRNVCVHDEIGENQTAGVVEEEIPVIEYEEANLTVTLTIYPPMTLYQPGERLRSVTALVKFKGEPAEGANVSGRLESIEPKNLTFSDEGAGYYSANIGYVIPGDEKKVVQLIVEATAGGEETTETERLLIDVEGDFLLRVNKPTSGSEVAPGEDVTFEGEVDKKRSTDQLSGVQVWLIDERTDEEFAMAGDDQLYSKDYTIPKNVRENAYFLMLARANVNGELSETAERISLIKASELYIEFKRSQQDVEKGKIAVVIRYTDENGDPIKDSRVPARITGYPSGVVQELELVRSGGVFIGNYKRNKRDNSAEIEVEDSYGNSGKAVLPPEFFEEVGSFELPWDIITLSGIGAATAIGAFLLLRLLMSRHASHNVEMKLLLGRKAQLEDLVKQTKAQFYKRQIDEETANKQIREYEESLATINKRLAERGKVPEIHAPASVSPAGSASVSQPPGSPTGNPPNA